LKNKTKKNIIPTIAGNIFILSVKNDGKKNPQKTIVIHVFFPFKKQLPTCKILSEKKKKTLINI
jgi:hypothetical protein